MNDRHLLLIGGGHAHVAVLADWIERGLPCKRATLLTPHPKLRYSGMVPGWIAGQYERDEGLVDLAHLANRAGARLVLDRCIAIEPEARRVRLASGDWLDFDIVSIDTGSVGQAREILGEDPRSLDIKPIAGFVERLSDLPIPSRVAVVGGGAGGTEIAFALRNSSRSAQRPQVVLVTGRPGLLPELSWAVRRKVQRELRCQRIALVENDARISEGALMAGDRSLEPVDLIVCALGSAAPEWPRAGGLACDENGFILVDAYQRSISHDQVFAVGDIASRQDRPVPHSGVHAVHAGKVLADNLRAAASGHQPSRSYVPRPVSLYLLSTANGSAIASYGPFAASGRWVAKWKHRIDTGWIAQYSGGEEGDR